MKKAFPLIIITISLLSQLLGGCANSSRSPSGGPKDTIAPIMVAHTPNYRATNFKGNEVSFAFNEYVQLKDANKQFTMSPPMEKKPLLKVKGKQVIVSFQSDLQPNTTYFLDFGKSITDLNEGNPIEELSTVFSTGNAIDSLVYVGRLMDAFTLESVEGAFAFLYEENIDSIPYLKVPSAMARADKDGVFLIKGLKPLSYKVMVVDDKNNNYKYDPGNEAIAFLDSLIRPISVAETDSIAYDHLPTLRVFSENVRKQFLGSYKRPEERLIELQFNQINPEIKSFDVGKLNSTDFIIEHSRNSDTLKYWIKAETVPDSVRVTLNYMKTDSLNQLSLTEVKLKLDIEKSKTGALKKDKEEKKSALNPTDTANAKVEESGVNTDFTVPSVHNDISKFKLDTEKPKIESSKKEKKLVLIPTINAANTRVVESGVGISFAAPLVHCDTSKLKLYKYLDEKGEKKELLKFSWIQDTLRIRNYTLQAAWGILSKYELVVLPDAFTDVYNNSNDTIKKTFDTADPDKFSSLIVNISNANGNYIVQLMKGKDVIAQKYTSKNGEVVFAYLDAGKYKIRIIEDKNANRYWDTGVYLQHIQPERVGFVKFTEGGSNELDLRQNWDVKQPVDISQIF